MMKNHDIEQMENHGESHYHKKTREPVELFMPTQKKKYWTDKIISIQELLLHLLFKSQNQSENHDNFNCSEDMPNLLYCL